ncbi:hypothetical protein QDR63_01500 [Acinetobacter baumannii]|uniref:hypothetical protein n=1 Tax=Acinetobacter baumannii TaxID=470 RepID=UPI002446F46E|nr:hypothetical protein [Acinetobacter baumannii]MDH2524972.1 hypothetical protein [Acinetobacter baumannii]
MPVRESVSESDIATAAASILRECFIKALHSEKVLYVENGILWSKSPNGQSVFIKKLSGWDASLSKKVTNRGKFKIKKKNEAEPDNEHG